ncbi:hypothetical protein ACER0C_010790 [Sarotherodon galilaeus]
MNTKRRSIGTQKHKHREGHTGQRHKGNLNDKEITHCKQGRPNCHGPGECWAFPQGRHFHPWAEPPHHADRLIIISPHPDHLPSKLCLRLRMIPALTDFPVSGSPFHPRQPHGFPTDTSSAPYSFAS